MKGIEEMTKEKVTFYFIDRSRDEGDYKSNKRTGNGVFYFIDGDRYEGEFNNYKFNGKGIYYFKNGEIRKWVIIWTFKNYESMIFLIQKVM